MSIVSFIYVLDLLKRVISRTEPFLEIWEGILEDVRRICVQLTIKIQQVFGDVEEGMHFGVHAFVTNILLHDFQELQDMSVENLHSFLELFLEKKASDVKDFIITESMNEGDTASI